MVKVHVALEKFDCEHLLGKFLDERHYNKIIDYDCDFYAPPACDLTIKMDCNEECHFCEHGMSEDRVVFKFRKNVFSKKLQKLAYENLKDAAISTENRGLASGTKEELTVTGVGREWVTNYQHEMLQALIKESKAKLIDDDPIVRIRAKYPTKEDRLRALGATGKNSVWVIERFRGKFDFDSWVDTLIPLSVEERAVAAEKIKEMQSETTYGNPVDSGIAGYYDRYPRIPFGREATYTRDNPEKFNASLPYVQELAKQFKKLMPDRHAIQTEYCQKLDPHFVIDKTPFTTITINKNFRTGAHRDAGDLGQGFSNLTVISNVDHFDGAYLILPEFKVAIDIQPGDLLLIANHDAIHGNAPFNFAPTDERISLVMYYREGLLECKSWEYERTREEFVNDNKNNPNHPLQRFRWNGIFEGMWHSEEWLNFLISKFGDDKVKEYEPVLYSRYKDTLEEFFT